MKAEATAPRIPWHGATTPFPAAASFMTGGAPGSSYSPFAAKTSFHRVQLKKGCPLKRARECRQRATWRTREGGEIKFAYGTPSRDSGAKPPRIRPTGDSPRAYEGRKSYSVRDLVCTFRSKYGVQIQASIRDRKSTRLNSSHPV